MVDDQWNLTAGHDQFANRRRLAVKLHHYDQIAN
jgi:hypothetical protein